MYNNTPVWEWIFAIFFMISKLLLNNLPVNGLFVTIRIIIHLYENGLFDHSSYNNTCMGMDFCYLLYDIAVS